MEPKYPKPNKVSNTSPLVSGGAGPSVDPSEFLLKEISPQLGGESSKKDKTGSTYDLVEHIHYLYVRVVKARDIVLFGGVELFVEVKLGDYKVTTKRSNAEWDQVFAIPKDSIYSSTMEIFVKERNKNNYIGRVMFELREVPRRVPPNSELEPQWYRMEDKKGHKAKTGDLLLSMWFGIQSDEAFAEAFCSETPNVNPDVLSCIKPKVYLSPKLWYLRVSIIEAQDIMPAHKGSQVVRFPQFLVDVQLGEQCLRTKNAAPSATRSFSNPCWDEELVFVVAEPFENELLVSVDDQVEPGRDVVVARMLLPVATIEKRAGDKPVTSRWFNLDRHFENVGDNNTKLMTRFNSRIHLRVSFDGEYNVVDDVTMYVRPRDPPIGVLEIGIVGATGLLPMKTDNNRGSTDAYCVAMYGEKWFRTRTVVDSLSPKWNEQYVWEVYDPCTVVTIGVFHNHRIDKNNKAGARDVRIGKIRIRLSTLETDRVYNYSYPLLKLSPSGLKKMGELQLAMRFSCTNMAKMLHKYTIPMLPRMHYVHPLSAEEISRLRYKGVGIVASRLSSVEPSLGSEVVEYMLDHNDSPMWSFRRSKVVFFRIMATLSWLIAMVKWLEAIRNWEKPLYSTLFLIISLTLVMLPEFILPTIFFYLVLVGLWNYTHRPQHPLYLDIRMSFADTVLSDELDEEFDTFPTTRSSDIVRWRYDRLRSVAGRLLGISGDFATLLERLEALLSWRDPRATFSCLLFCLLVAVVFYVVTIRVVVALFGLYLLRPPRFRSKLASPVLNFYCRLPSKDDTLISETMHHGCLDLEGLLIIRILEDFQQTISLFV
ncbi:hypothetical protein TanjilG_24570 [Lupinus angustifolius]|uniref:C2 domain-containing protein n=1 Tax=Lupinus angustifolius TaxID=3871 RepID=A0A4P1RKC3_LUPAN|nr:PREDICTED: FT-interacting protein 1-like [Lupinus angustifolius]OIW12637.1 hypothetical protein TanjilG_24570 [Lupinus angustifolius]